MGNALVKNHFISLYVYKNAFAPQCREKTWGIAFAMGVAEFEDGFHGCKETEWVMSRYAIHNGSQMI